MATILRGRPIAVKDGGAWCRTEPTCEAARPRSNLSGILVNAAPHGVVKALDAGRRLPATSGLTGRENEELKVRVAESHRRVGALRCRRHRLLPVLLLLGSTRARSGCSGPITCPYAELRRDFGVVGMPLLETGARYDNACKLGDELVIHTWVDEWAGRTFLVKHRVAPRRRALGARGLRAPGVGRSQTRRHRQACARSRSPRRAIARFTD